MTPRRSAAPASSTFGTRYTVAVLPLLSTLLLPLAAARPIPLTGLTNHDLVAGDIRVLDWRADADPDAVTLTGALSLPLTGTATTLTVLTAGLPDLPERGGMVALDGELVYADGAVQPLKWIVGSQIWPMAAGVTGRGADPVPIGSGPDGTVWTASQMTVPVAFPDHALATLRLRPRLPGTFLLAVALDAPAAPQLAAEPDAVRWYDFALPGLLDRPLPGPPAALVQPDDRGFLSVVDGHLAWGAGAAPGAAPGASGATVRARFWGVNLVGRAALPDPALAEGYARSLAGAGVNLVRLHHLDFDGEGSLVNPRRGEPGQAAIVPAALDRLDRFTAALGAAGVYQEVELLTLRSFRAGEGVTAPEGVPGFHKYVGAFEPDWLAAEKAWAKALWGRVNPYTGLRYADNPHVALVELANENSLLAGWASGNLEKLPAVHRTILDARWSAWLRQRYPEGDAALGAAWAGGSHAGLAAGEALVLDSVAREPSSRARAELYPARRVADLVRFYSELQGAYEAELARFVREDLGFRVPLVCNSALGVPVSDALLGACDVIDVHVYWDPIAEETIFDDVPLTRDAGRARVLEKLGACQAGHPCMLGEVNHSWPNRYGQEAPLLWAALAARQDLDAVVWFAYRHDALRTAPDGPDGALDLEGRFHVWAQFPVAAALFRGAWVPPAAQSFVRWWSEEGLRREVAGPAPLRVDAAVAPASYLRQRVRSAFGGSPPVADSRIDPADTGGLTWTNGAFTVDTPEVQVVIGAGPATSRLATHLNTFSAVSLVSLDDRPLERSDRALVIAAGRAERRGTLWNAVGLLVPGRGPLRMQVLVGRIFLCLAGEWDIWALDGRGVRTHRVRPGRVSRDEGRALPGGRGDWWALDAADVAPWVELRR